MTLSHKVWIYRWRQVISAAIVIFDIFPVECTYIFLVHAIIYLFLSSSRVVYFRTDTVCNMKKRETTTFHVVVNLLWLSEKIYSIYMSFVCRHHKNNVILLQFKLIIWFYSRKPPSSGQNIWINDNSNCQNKSTNIIKS